jgi:hypothetical protein
VNSRLVESAIAGTIVATSLLAIVVAARSGSGQGPAVSARGQSVRYAMAAGFGLIHGLGFSTFLRSLLGEGDSLFVPLLSFNIGLELGQLSIVAGVLVLGVLAERVVRLARRDWVLVTSGAIAAIGTKMIVERMGS